MGRKRDKLGKSQQAKATTNLRRSPRGSPATLNTLNKNQSSKNPKKGGNENVVFALEIAHADPVGETSSAEEALPEEEGINTGPGNPSAGTLTDVAGGMADTANSNKQLVTYEDSDDDKAHQDKLTSDDETTAAAKAKSSLRELLRGFKQGCEG